MNRSKLTIFILALICCVLVIAYIAKLSSDTSPTNHLSRIDGPNEPTASGQPLVKPTETPEPVETADASAQKKPEKEAPGTPEPPTPEQAKKQDKPEPSKVDKSAEATAETKPVEDLGDPNDPIVAINLKDTPMANIIQKIGEWTGKVIIPHDDAMKQKITIYSTRKMPRSKALSMIYTALHSKGFLVEQTDSVIYLKPLNQAKLTSVPTVSADDALAAIDNKDLIVQKFFRLKNYSPARLQEIILPLIAEYGYITADETTRSLVVIDTVSNLIRIERIISQLDVPQAGPTVTRVFEIHDGDPTEMVQLLRILVGDGVGNSGNPGRGNRSRKPSPPPGSSEKPPSGGSKSSGPATSVVISSRKAPIVLIPEPKRQWIIAKASPDDMDQIGEWIVKLDKKEPIDTKRTIIKVQHVNVRELAEHINNTMQKMPGQEIRSNVMVLPMEKTRTLLVFGSEDNRQIVENLIDEIDIPPDIFETRHFKLKFAKPEQIKQYIEELHTASGTQSSTYRSPYSSSYNRSRRSDTGPDMVRAIAYPDLRQVTVITSPTKMEKIAEDIAKWDRPYDYEKYESRDFPLEHADPEQIKSYIEELYTEDGGSFNPFDRYRPRNRGTEENDDDMVRVISYASLQQVTVIASPRNLEKIAKQIAEWDQPLEVDKVKPMIVELRNSDPVKMAKLLSTLFSEGKSSSFDPFDFIFGRGRGRGDTQKQIVGPLYGQLSFEAVPDTKKIIVISKIPEAYNVVRQLIEELDRQETAELPTVVTLKYADPEDLCERLNALLNETGTNAIIHLAKRELSSYAPGAASDETNATNNRNTEGRRDVQPNEYKPWWTTARNRPDEEQPISNIIGRIRFIPDHRSKAILVLCPSEYTESVKQMIEELDQPAQQVMVKAVILEINHEKMTSLGLQIANSPSVFGALTENALTALAGLTYAETFGSVNFDSSLNVSGLIDFLIKTTDAKILNQPTLWAKDNEEATFFRGKTVPFIANSRESAEGGAFTQNFEEKEVGVTMRVRPNITPKKAVDMNINIIISQVEPDLLLGNIVRSETNTSTHMIVGDGGTILLSGILFQKDVTIERKIPLLGDIPLLGGLFRHNDILKTNNEILIFITPYVMEGNAYGTAAEEIDKATDKMLQIKEKLQTAVTGEE